MTTTTTTTNYCYNNRNYHYNNNRNCSRNLLISSRRNSSYNYNSNFNKDCYINSQHNTNTHRKHDNSNHSSSINITILAAEGGVHQGRGVWVGGAVRGGPLPPPAGTRAPRRV